MDLLADLGFFIEGAFQFFLIFFSNFLEFVPEEAHVFPHNSWPWVHFTLNNCAIWKMKIKENNFSQPYLSLHSKIQAITAKFAQNNLNYMIE